MDLFRLMNLTMKKRKDINAAMRKASIENAEKLAVMAHEETGYGRVADKIIKNIFDPFSTTKKEKGTGLGLSISYGIIKKLGGDIFVDSAQGKGSVFTIVLPEKTNEMESENEK